MALNQPLVASVLRRWKTANTFSVEDYEFVGDSDELEGYISDDLKLVRKYTAKCAAFAKICRSLAGPLKAPKIGDTADKVEKRAKDLTELTGILQGALVHARSLDNEWKELEAKLAGEDPSSWVGLVEKVNAFPSMQRLQQLAKEAEALHYRLLNEDSSENNINWLLEGFIGDETTIYSALEKIQPELLEYELNGAKSLLGFIHYWQDEESLRDYVSTHE